MWAGLIWVSIEKRDEDECVFRDVRPTIWKICSDFVRTDQSFRIHKHGA